MGSWIQARLEVGFVIWRYRGSIEWGVIPKAVVVTLFGPLNIEELEYDTMTLLARSSSKDCEVLCETYLISESAGANTRVESGH